MEADTPDAKKLNRDTADPSVKPSGVKEEPRTAAKRTADGIAKRTTSDTAKAPAKRLPDAASFKRADPEAAVAVKKEEPADGPPRTAHKRPREEAEASKAAGKVLRRTTAEDTKVAADAEAQNEPKRRKVSFAHLSHASRSSCASTPRQSCLGKFAAAATTCIGRYCDHRAAEMQFWVIV